MIRSSGGWAEDASDDEIVAGIELLATSEGIFGETAAGVTVGCAQVPDRAGPHPPGRGDRALHHGQRPENHRRAAGSL